MVGRRYCPSLDGCRHCPPGSIQLYERRGMVLRSLLGKMDFTITVDRATEGREVG